MSLYVSVQGVKHDTLTQCWAIVDPSSSFGLPCPVWRHAECGSVKPAMCRCNVRCRAIVYDAGQHLNGIGAVYAMCTHSRQHEVLRY